MFRNLIGAKAPSIEASDLRSGFEIMPQDSAPRPPNDPSSVRRRCPRPVRDSVAKPLVRTFAVEVLDVLLDQMVQVRLAEDHEVIQALGLDRPDPALGKGVELRRARRELFGAAAAGAQRLVELAPELPVAVAKQDGWRFGAHRGCPFNEAGAGLFMMRSGDW